ncbi:hypothetical protein DSO57_1037108 [Entomophthora muscae]|uniref:Uncharacterized protein n=1 Tax=Entomophthora muscae TaxID=34485 RepID=A0ACC2U8P7_9FUNG|nr:hypothetical protein DSO57_1037108 [Entomophthora muscae]
MDFYGPLFACVHAKLLHAYQSPELDIEMVPPVDSDPPGVLISLAADALQVSLCKGAPDGWVWADIITQGFRISTPATWSIPTKAKGTKISGTDSLALFS